MLELRDAELQLVPIVARHEAQLAEEVAQPLARSLTDAHRVAAPAARELVEQRTELVEPRTENGTEAVERIAFRVRRALGTAVTGLVHGASTCAADGGAPASLPRR